ncbi:MAG TPA: hypothetical protein PL005_04350 [Candidatus Hydrogenedentes bacterium]|nr:hypothetical protein [Candidatus Hydrogenedentota bacterium]
MVVNALRSVFVIASGIMGYLWANYFVEASVLQGNEAVNELLWKGVGVGIGAVVAALVLLAVRFITQEIYERLAPAVVAVVIAILLGFTVSQYMLYWFPKADTTLKVFVAVSVVLMFGYVGIYLALSRASNWTSLVQAVQKRSVPVGGAGSLKLVDTSVLIDGRISDICASGFIEGSLLVPRFVLKELQNIADSAEVLRRAKGRRGLDILKDLQDPKSMVVVVIIEEDPVDVREVDGKLVKLAKQLGAKVLTNDFNLNKVAQIEGVSVLNINDLANALKPAVLPDEQIEVKLIKEGKEPNQGVGYLDDGTMIVVDGGRHYMGKTVAAVVTSVLQTAAGRMIFARYTGVIQ